jgi:hypothetical protein
VVAATIIALLVTGLVGLYRGDFQVVQTFWAVVAAPLGWIIGYYFRGTGSNGKEDHTSPA